MFSNEGSNPTGTRAWPPGHAGGHANQAGPVVRLELERVDGEPHAPERGLRHGELEDVVEDPPAAVHFPEAVTCDVPRRPRSWRELFAERKVDRLGAPRRPHRTVERDRLVLRPQARVDGQPAGHGPRVLHEQANGRIADVAERDETTLGIGGVAEHAVIAVPTPLTCDRGVPEQVDAVGAPALVHIVTASIELQAGLEHVLPRQAAEIRGIDLRVDARQPIDTAHVV